MEDQETSEHESTKITTYSYVSDCGEKNKKTTKDSHKSKTKKVFMVQYNKHQKFRRIS